MQPTQPTAIPFVYLHNDQFIVSQQAKQFLSQITSPISVLTIVGKYRTGKSLFLNRIMLGKSRAFKVSPTINSCTRGLWLWKDTLKFKHEEQEKQVLIIDTEGFGATEESDAYNNKILLFALLLSSYFVYNSVGSIDQNSLNNISVLANLANDIQSKNSKQENIQQNFPSFLWLVRDFTLNLVDKNDIPIQAKEYLEQALEIQKGTSNLIEGKNRIRRMMKHFFRDRDCFTLVRPVETEDKLQQLDTLQEEDFRATFLDQAKALRQKILQKIKPKKLKNTLLSGQTFFELAKNYVQVVNSNSLPNFENSYKHLLKLEMCGLKRTICQQHEGKIISLVKQSMRSLKSYQDFEQMKQKYLTEVESSSKQKIKSHHSLSAFINSEQISTLINQIKSTTSHVIDKSFHSIKQEMKFKYVSAIDRLKEDNLMRQPLNQIYTDKEFKEFAQGLLNDLNQLLGKHHIAEFLMTEFHAEYFVPFKQELIDQFNELNSKRLHESNHEMKIRLEMKEETLKSRQAHCEKLENELKDCRKLNSQLEMKVVRLEKQLKFAQNQAQQNTTKLQSAIQNIQQQNSALTSKSLQLSKQLQIRNQEILELTKVLEQKGSEYSMTDRELAIQRERLEAKTEELNERKLVISRLSEQLEEKASKVDLLTRKVEQLRASKQQLYEKYLTSSQQSSQKLVHLEGLASRQATQLKQLKKANQTAQVHHQQQCTYLKQLLHKQHLHNQQLTSANTHLTSTIANLQQAIAYFHQRQSSYKQFKKCMKNSSSVQCQHCERFFMSSIFLTHLGVCTVFREKEGVSGGGSREQVKEEEIVQFRVVNVAVHENNDKPYTIYELECQKGAKKWTIEKKFTQFCQFNQNLQASLPGVQFSPAKAIFDPKYLSKKSLSVEEKQHLIEKYFNDMGQNPSVHTNKFWIEFISSKSPQDSTESINTKRTVLKQINNSSNTLNYQMRKSQIRDENAKPATNTQGSRRESMHTPEEFFKIWEQKQLRTKASSVCLKKGQNE